MCVAESPIWGYGYNGGNLHKTDIGVGTILSIILTVNRLPSRSMLPKVVIRLWSEAKRTPKVAPGLKLTTGSKVEIANCL